MGTYCASTVAAAGPFEKGAAILLLAITGAGIVVAEVLLRGERSTFKDALLMAKALCMILKFYCLFVTQYSVVLQCILFLWIKDIKLVVFTDQMNPQVKRRINLVEENADARCGCWSGVLWERLRCRLWQLKTSTSCPIIWENTQVYRQFQETRKNKSEFLKSKC